MAVFSTGRYVDEIMIENETALFQSRTVITDSIRYDTMVALPL
jgi:anthranilate 1,2-dioxygenase small subunit